MSGRAPLARQSVSLSATAMIDVPAKERARQAGAFLFRTNWASNALKQALSESLATGRIDLDHAHRSLTLSALSPPTVT